MTEPRDVRRDPPTEAPADPGPEVRPEVIRDLDVTGDDPDAIVGGCIAGRQPISHVPW